MHRAAQEQETRPNNDARTHANSRRPLTRKDEPALQLSLSQHEISQMTSDPAPSLQMEFFSFSHPSLGEQSLRYNSCSSTFQWTLMHWSSVGGHSIFLALQSSHEVELEHAPHSRPDAERRKRLLVHEPGPQNFEFLTTLRDKGYHTFLETLFSLLYFYV